MGKCNKFDIVGKIKGRLTVLSFHHVADEKSFWLCQCQCGNQKVIARTSIINNKSGSNSCGCLHLEKRRLGKHGYAKPGHKKSPEYICWVAIKDRCYHKTGERYSDYGGRGIRVCERWLKSFPNFLSDMGNRPTAQHSIDRIDVNGDYSPENCRWATRIEQANNKRNNVVITYNGDTMTLPNWATRLKINPDLIRSRLNSGWSIEDAFLRPIDYRFSNKKT